MTPQRCNDALNPGSTPPTCSRPPAGASRYASRWGGWDRALTASRRRVVLLDAGVGAVPQAALGHQAGRPPSRRPVHRLVQPEPPAQLVPDELAPRLRGDPHRAGGRTRLSGGGGVKTSLHNRLSAPERARVAPDTGPMTGSYSNQRSSTIRGEAHRPLRAVGRLDHHVGTIRAPPAPLQPTLPDCCRSAQPTAACHAGSSARAPSGDGGSRSRRSLVL
jgi:hypothetical protein